MISTKLVTRASCLLLLITPTVFSAVPANPVPGLDVRLTDVHGPVQVAAADRKIKGAPPVYLPFILSEGDFIRTSSSGTAEIAFRDGTLVQLGPNTAVKLTHLSEPRIELRLSNGVLLARVHFDKGEGNQFRVVTPSAIATVRGTEMVVEESGFRAHIAVLDEGHVSVTAPGFKKSVMLHFNQETQVTRGLSPQDAHVLDRLYHHKIQMAQMRQRIPVVRKQWKTKSSDTFQLERVRAAWVKRNTPPAKR